MASTKMMIRRGESGLTYAPPGFIKLQYIHTDGVARIYTGQSIANDDIRTILYAKQTSAGPSSIYRAFMAVATGYTALRFGYPSGSGNAGFESGLSVFPRSTFMSPFKLIINWKRTGISVTVGRNTRSATRSAYTGTNGPALPGTTNINDNQTGVPMDIYRLLVYKAGELVQNWQPVKKIDTGEIGLLDVINGTFKASYATDTPFTAGPEA